MKISEKTEDFKIYVEDEKHNYISTSFILESETRLDKIITCKVKLKSLKDEFNLNLTRDQIRDLSELLDELVTHL